MAGLIQRGDFWVVDLEPGFGREIHKKRPGLIISDNSFNITTPYVIVVPTTAIVPNILSEEMVNLGKPKGFAEDSVLLPLYIRSIDKGRLMKKIGRITKGKLMEAEKKLKLVLGITSLD